MLGLTPFNRNQIQKRSGDMMDIYNLFDDFFDDNFFGMRNLRNDTFKMDVRDEGQAYAVEAELPGIQREEIKLDYQENRLIICVERNEEVNEEKGNYIHRERRSSSMARSLYLKDIKVEGIEAKLEDGVLKIRIPKAEQTNGRIQIEVK